MKLVEVRLLTELGKTYTFPDVDAAIAERLVCSWDPTQENVTLVNEAEACLIIPTRRIKTVYIDGLERWKKTYSTV